MNTIGISPVIEPKPCLNSIIDCPIFLQGTLIDKDMIYKDEAFRHFLWRKANDISDEEFREADPVAQRYILFLQNFIGFHNSKLGNTIRKAGTDNNIEIVQINVKGLTISKADIIYKLFLDADVLAIQETHVPESEANRLRIDDFHMMNYIGHRSHGLATYINEIK
ncbi:Hypothetical protein CINCED_3A003428 [Cinara cedri]|nr:Hypothetical protein CINCED_3A003428 [Cinara cedri]